MAEDNTGITVAADSNGSEDSEDESCDIPVIAVTEISEPEDITEKSIDIPVIAVTEISESESITEETIDLPVTEEMNEPEGSNVKITKETNTPESRPKILSRYLLPSAGSCHDFCKYGMKHSFEGKLESPVLRKVKSTVGNGQDFKRIISLAKQDKRAMSMKSSSDYNTQINTNDLKEDLISSPKIVTLSPKRPLPPIKEVEAVVVHCSATKLASSQSKWSSLARQGCSSTKINKEFGKGKEQDRGSSSRTNCIEEDKKALVAPAVSCTSKKHVKRIANAGKNIIGRYVRNQSHVIKIKPVQSNNEDKQEKTLYMIEPSIEKETEGSAQNNVHRADLSQPQSLSATDNGLKHDRELDQTPKVPPLSVEKNARHGRTGICSKKVLASSSLSWGFKGLRHKKFGIVSTQSSPSSSTSPSNPIHSNHGVLASGNDVKKSQHPKVELKSKPRRMGISESENRDIQSRRLKFRKGRVVDIQPENNTPRRLKFRRVRLLGETQNCKSNSGKRSIQGKEANHNDDEAKETENNAFRLQDQELKRKKNYRRKETIDGKPTAHRIKYERVVLRHQDSKEKKKLQNLFNNVIEETASKLAQTRKSKVKALVGAFETVISLQDTRPSATIGA